VKVGAWKRYEQFSDPAISGVAKFENADETIPICLVALKEPLAMEENVARFDFGICMAAWDGEKRITDKWFSSDYENQAFTLYRADSREQFAYSMVRFKKLTADRYAGWKLCVPEEFELLAKDHTFRRYWYQDEHHYYWSGDNGHYGMSRESSNELRPKDR
jgi:hypothetical protein